MIVSKFGGSSVKDAEAMRRCAEIVENNGDIRVVILSATYNTTNELEKMGKLAESGELPSAILLLQKIKERHYQIAKELEAPASAYQMIDSILSEGESLLAGISMLKECSDRALDRLYSIGERMSSALFAGILTGRLTTPVLFVDAREVIITDGQFRRAKPQIAEIRSRAEQKLLPALATGAIIVTQGFIGSDQHGVTTTLGREGSDFSAALIAEAIDASACYIWTDVAGIYTTDPRHIAEAKKIDTLSYLEATTMARLGAKVLFPETLAPAERKSIPVYVGSSLDAKKLGTWIYPENQVQERPLFRALAKSDAHPFIQLRNIQQLPTALFHKSILDLLDRNRIRYDLLRLSPLDVQVVLAEKSTVGEMLIKELEQVAEVVRPAPLSRISLIGNFRKQTKAMAKVWQAIDGLDFPLEFVDSEDFAMCFYVGAPDGQKLLQALHRLLLES